MQVDSFADRKLVQVALMVRDLPGAIAFYRDTLGLPFLFETNGMAFFQLAGGTRLMLGAGGEAGGGYLYFDAPDLPAAAAALEAKGITFLGPAQVLQKTEAGTLQLRSFRDPDGNAISLLGLVPAG